MTKTQTQLANDSRLDSSRKVRIGALRIHIIIKNLVDLVVTLTGNDKGLSCQDINTHLFYHVAS